MKKNHMWLMIACCLIPLAGLVAVYLFKIPVGTAFLAGMVLFCPLSHLLMMAFWGHSHEESHAAGSHVHSQPE